MLPERNRRDILDGHTSTVLFRQCLGRLIVSHPGVRVSQVGWLSEVNLLQQAMGKAANVGSLKHKAVSQVASNGKVKNVGIRRLQLIVQPKSNGEPPVYRRWRNRK